MIKTFKETTDIYPAEKRGAYQSFDIKEMIYQSKDCDHIQVFETQAFGKVLAIDGAVQFTEADEFIYHEMLVHVPMMSGPDKPVDILIIGGGDGGCVREALKHDVHSITMIEQDAAVCEVARACLSMSEYLDHEKLRIINGDAADVLRRGLRKKFDVAIIDVTDPTTKGGSAIYNRQFMASLEKHIGPVGVIGMMTGLPMMQGVAHVRRIDEFMKFMGYITHHYTTTVPSYYGGLCLMAMYCRSPREDVLDVFEPPALLSCRHYSAAVHEHAFVLPRWLEEMIYAK